MGLSLAGIIAVQILWIDHAVGVRQSLLSDKINSALQQTVKKLKRKATVLFIEEKSEGLNINTKISKGGNVSSSQMIRVREEDSSSGAHVFLRNAEQQVYQTIRILEDSIQHHETDSLGQILIKSALDSDTSQNLTISVDAGRVKKKLWHFNQTLSEWIIETEVSDDPVAARIETASIEKELTNALENSGITFDFEYAIIDEENDSITQYKSEGFDREFVNTPYRVSVFPEDIMEKSVVLAVHIYNRRGEIFRSLLWLLLGSMLFTIAIISAFAVTLHIVFRQKKISRIKSDFINNMSHEFKTPIATISLAADSMLNKKIYENPELIKRYSKVIKQESKRMNTQVENVLQMALLDSERFTLNLKKADIHQIIKRAAEGLKLSLEKKSGIIEFYFFAKDPFIETDEIHFYNVIYNLLDNAVKYCDEAPKIKVYTEAIKGGIQVRVKDNGIGMSTEVQSKVFDRFYRETTGNIHNVKGFGLGLSYVKTILLNLKGTIHLKSDRSKGSEFFLFFPKTLTNDDKKKD